MTLRQQMKLDAALENGWRYGRAATVVHVRELLHRAQAIGWRGTFDELTQVLSKNDLAVARGMRDACETLKTYIQKCDN